MTSEPDPDAFVASTLKWFRLRGFPRLRSADIDEPLIFFTAASWGPWALLTGADDMTALGSRASEGWLVTDFRRQLREHLLILDPRLNFRTVEKEEDALAHRFLDIALIYVDAFFAGRPAGETSSRLLAMVLDAKNLLMDLVRPFTKKVSTSRDPLERIRWKQLKQLLFGNGTSGRSSSSSSSSSDCDENDSATHPKTKGHSRSARRAILRAHRHERGKGRIELGGGPTFADFGGGNAEADPAAPPEREAEREADAALPHQDDDGAAQNQGAAQHQGPPKARPKPRNQQPRNQQKPNARKVTARPAPKKRAPAARKPPQKKK
jgi:hypothetical protein